MFPATTERCGVPDARKTNDVKSFGALDTTERSEGVSTARESCALAVFPARIERCGVPKARKTNGVKSFGASDTVERSEECLLLAVFPATLEQPVRVGLHSRPTPIYSARF
ncbi:hypothetical protein GCM10025298_23090 [Natronobiforma cellulositropha]